MKGIPLVRASAFLPFVRFLDGHGLPLDPALARSRSLAAALDRPEALIPVHQACAFVDDVSRAEGVEHIGFVVGGGMSLASLGAFGRIVARSLTLEQTLRSVIRLQPHMNSGGRVWLAAEGDRVWLRHGQDRRIEHGWQHFEELAVAMMLHIVRSACGACGSVDVELRARATPGLGEIELLGNTRVAFGRACTGIAFPRSWLSATMPPDAGPARSLLELERRLVASGPAPDFSGSIRQTIATLLLDGYPDVRVTADAIGMSVRTLQRRLSDSGVSYSRLVEEERFREALRLLANPNVRVTDVAIELGYADLANFSHAFHRWTGASPTEYRLVL